MTDDEKSITDNREKSMTDNEKLNIYNQVMVNREWRQRGFSTQYDTDARSVREGYIRTFKGVMPLRTSVILCPFDVTESAPSAMVQDAFDVVGQHIFVERVLGNIVAYSIQSIW